MGKSNKKTGGVNPSMSSRLSLPSKQLRPSGLSTLRLLGVGSRTAKTLTAGTGTDCAALNFEGWL